LQLSRTNEEAFQLEISRLKQSLAMKEKENEILLNENRNLKNQVKKYEENFENLLEENRNFRTEAEKKFSQYNREIELLNSRTGNAGNLADRNEENRDREEINYLSTNENAYNLYNSQNSYSYVNNFKRDNNHKKRQQQNANVMNNLNLSTNQSAEINRSNAGDIDNQMTNANNNNLYENANNIYVRDSDSNYDPNNFTNGNPNIIEEVGADNYLNMNGNTYDEMKDMKEDDNLHDHQYLENIHSSNVQINSNYDQINDYSIFNKKPNTGDTFNQAHGNVNIFASNSGGESGTTNNIFNSKF
jgi:hypothetical protein